MTEIRNKRKEQERREEKKKGNRSNKEKSARILAGCVEIITVVGRKKVEEVLRK